MDSVDSVPVIAICRVTLHENLFFATREIGRLYETGRYLHNYALSYALGLAVAPYHSVGATPRYADDLTGLNATGIYVTPAQPLGVGFELVTFKYADNRYRVKMEQSSRNTPSYGRAKELAAGSRFEVAVISPQPLLLPTWIRLGKWMSKARLEVIHMETTARRDTGDYVAGLPLNPLDLPEETTLLAYDLISMPPASLLDHAYVAGPHLVLQDGRALPAGLAYRFPVQVKGA